MATKTKRRKTEAAKKERIATATSTATSITKITCSVMFIAVIIVIICSSSSKMVVGVNCSSLSLSLMSLEEKTQEQEDSLQKIINNVQITLHQNYNQQEEEEKQLGRRRRKVRSSSPYSYERKILHRAPEGPPKIQPTIANVNAFVGTNATLECFIESYPRAVNYWMIDSARLKEDTEKYKITDDPINYRNFEFRHRLRLYIFNVDGFDYTSTFRCFATNEHGTNYEAIRILGHKPIIHTVNNATTIESAIGSDFTLECIISAVPEDINYWTRGSKDEIIVASPKYSITQQSYNNRRYQTISKLQVFDVQIKDLTTYKCKSKNINGEAERKFQVIKSGYLLPKRDEKSSSANRILPIMPMQISSSRNSIYFFLFSITLIILKFS